jgi:type I restriction enzyme, S subunit
VITQAVTKSLNPNVPMKDSGVEWLGEVPEHWAVLATGYKYFVALGKMLDEKRISGRWLAPYLRNVDVQWDRINVDDLPVMDFAPTDRSRYKLKRGDLLVCEGGEVGRAAMWTHDQEDIFYQKALHRLRPLDPHQDNPRFMMYLLWMSSEQGRFISNEGRATIAHLTAEALRRYLFAFPPRAEQDSIVAYIDTVLALFSRLTTSAERSIALLQEHRSALITASVTGQIDLRDAA